MFPHMGTSRLILQRLTARRVRRRWLSAAALGALILAPAARAAEPQVSISVGNDPVESITTQLGASGTGPSSDNVVELKVKPTGGEGCGANPGADKGEYVASEAGSGTQTFTRNWTFSAAGAYLLCAWLSDGTQSGSPVIAHNSATMTVRPPHISLSIAVPATVHPHQIFQITTTAQSETARDVYQFILPLTGRGCPVNAGAAGSTSGEEISEWPSIGSAWQVTGGPFTASLNESFSGVGGYLVCAYAEYPSSSSVPEAVASAGFSVVLPPPPCVVPHLTSSSTLGSVEHRLLAAHCKVGKIRYIHTAHYSRGRVLSLSPRPGSRVANGTRVAIRVSSGHHRH
jgi:hypothetical protein